MNPARFRIPPADAVRMARKMRKVIAIRGRTVTTFDMGDNPPDDDALAAAIIGPTGNLRAPSIRIGDTLVVGFDAAQYASAFSAES